MLKIRLQRVGRVHEPSFRLVLTDSQNGTKSGKFKEILGSYDPRKTTDALNADRIKYWITKGAQVTPTVHNLLVTHKVLDAKKIHVSTKSKFVPVPVAEPVVEEVKEEVVETVEEAPAEVTETPEIPAETVENATIETAAE